MGLLSLGFYVNSKSVLHVTCEHQFRATVTEKGHRGQVIPEPGPKGASASRLDNWESLLPPPPWLRRGSCVTFPPHPHSPDGDPGALLSGY